LVLTTAVAGTAAVQEVQTIAFATVGLSNAAQGWTLRIAGEDVTSVTNNADTSPTTGEFNTNLAAAINASVGAQAGRWSAAVNGGNTAVVVTFAATEGDVANITVRTLVSLSTAGAASASAANHGSVTVTHTSTGVLADVVDVVWSDFSSVDFIGRGNLTLSAGGYYEGAISGATQATEYGLMVITDQSYASIDAVESAINTRLTDASDDDMLVVFMDSALGHAVVFYDSDMDTDGAGTTNSIITLTGITTLSGLAAAFSDTGATFST